MNRNARIAEARETSEHLAREIEGFVGQKFMKREDARGFVAPAEAEFLLALSA